MRTPTILASAVIVLATSAPSMAQTTSAPGAVDLSQTFAKYDGKPIPNAALRTPALRVLAPIEVNGTKYARGTEITDLAKVREIVVGLQAQKAPSGDRDMTFAVEQIDPDCEKCEPLRLRWVLSQALVFTPCQATPGQPKSKFCTADEEKAEADPVAMEGRRRMAYDMSPAAEDKATTPLPSVVLGPKSIALLDNLVAARFDGNSTVVVQAQEMIDKNVHERGWGSE